MRDGHVKVDYTRHRTEGERGRCEPGEQGGPENNANTYTVLPTLKVLDGRLVREGEGRAG
jgi:hypothetical protein